MKNKAVKLLLYCTKAKPNLMDFNLDRKHFNIDYGGQVLNGKIVAEAECDLVELIEFKHYCDDYLGEDGKYYQTYNLDQDNLLKMSCSNEDEIDDYLKSNDGYAIYLKNVKPFDKLKGLRDYYKPQTSCMNSFGWLVDSMEMITKAPQNMMYAYDKDGNLYVLISIKPEWLCKILNGEKTIEVRKSILNVLKEMIKNNGTNINVVSAYCR